MLDKFFKNDYLRPYWNPFIWSDIRALGDYRGINDIKRETPVIVSITAEKSDFEKLPVTLYSILTQSMVPDKVILWLSEEYENLSALPYEITQFVKNGLEVKLVKDLKGYNNSIYAFEQCGNAVIVTAKSGFCYDKDWLKRLYTSYIINPKDIQVYCAKSVVDSSKNFLPYDRWTIVTKEDAEYSNFIISDFGVLYPPNCFSSEVLRKDIFMKYPLNNPDIWLWIMAVVHNRKIRVIKNRNNNIRCLNYWKKVFKNDSMPENASGIDYWLNLYAQNVYPKVLK